MLKVVNICKKFQSQIALEDINLEIRDGEFFSLLGPSGCGKTTLLRIIAGFEQATSGDLLVDSVRINDIRPQDRPFNMVFQKYALFPHLSVAENIAFGLKVKGVERKVLGVRVEEALRLVNLWDYKDRLPETLSGGQAQRVALARAVANKPKILLLDEPLSALDQKMREHMQTELRELQRRVGITFIFVTHDQEEAFALSDRVAVLNQGRLEQVSTPEQIYNQPSTRFVAQFVGASGSLNGQGRKIGPEAQAEVTLHDGCVVRGAGPINDGQPAVAVVRPEKIQIWVIGQRAKSGATLEGSSVDTCNSVKGVIQSTLFKGSQREVQVMAAGGQQLRVFVRDTLSSEKLINGAPVHLKFDVKDTYIYPAENPS